MKSRMAIITFTDDDGGNRPDNSLPGGGGGGNRPDNSLPPGGAWLPVYPFDPTIDNSLPGQGGRPDNSLPGSQPGVDNTLPGGRPPRPTQPIQPGGRFVVKWFACQGLILVPDNTLPETPQPKKA
jgi:hypothetical protein